MTTFERLRLYHATLAITAIAVYATGELGLIHVWLGCVLAALIVFRLAWGLIGSRQISLSKFIPKPSDFRQITALDHPLIGKVLLAGVAISLLLATFTGIALDQPSYTGSALPGPAIGLTGQGNAPAVVRAGFEFVEDSDEREDGWVGELHEATANLFLIFVGLHAAYLLLFKRNVALFMLFRKPSSPA